MNWTKRWVSLLISSPLCLCLLLGGFVKLFFWSLALILRSRQHSVERRHNSSVDAPLRQVRLIHTKVHAMSYEHLKTPQKNEKRFSHQQTCNSFSAWASQSLPRIFTKERCWFVWDWFVQMRFAVSYPWRKRWRVSRSILPWLCWWFGWWKRWWGNWTWGRHRLWSCSPSTASLTRFHLHRLYYMLRASNSVFTLLVSLFSTKSTTTQWDQLSLQQHQIGMNEMTKRRLRNDDDEGVEEDEHVDDGVVQTSK